MTYGTFYTLRNQDGEICVVTYEPISREEITYSVTDEELAEMNMDRFFTQVSKRIAFDDCSNEEILAIFYKGKEIHYAGWQVGMRFEYRDAEGNAVWAGDFPHWDH